MSITVSHTALDQVSVAMPAAAVTITEIDVYGVDVPASSHGPYSETADGDGAWTKAVDGGFKYRVQEVGASGTIQWTFVDVPASAGPYDLAAILFTLTNVAPDAVPVAVRGMYHP